MRGARGGVAAPEMPPSSSSSAVVDAQPMGAPALVKWLMII